MKNQIILLLSSLVIIFIAGYIESITDPYYPVTGTFGINGNKVSYKLDKTHYGNSPFEVTIISDIQNLEGLIKWKVNGNWQADKMKTENNLLKGTIISQKPNSIIYYQIILSYEGNEYIIPEKQPVKLKTYGKIPSFVIMLYLTLLYGGMFLSVRTGLEVFNESKMLKKFSFIQSAVYLVLALLISPLYVSYKLNAINNSVLPIMTMFDIRITLLAVISLISSVLVFNIRKSKIISIVSAAVMIFIFIMVN